MIESLNKQWYDRLNTTHVCAGKRLVTGEGCADEPVLMLVGEAPGGQEEAQGRPFVGRAGQNLNVFLEILGLKRQNIYITNTVKIRPTAPGKNGKEKNRPPRQAEIDVFSPWLIDEIRQVRPRLLVTLGNTPLKAVMGKEALIGRVHGETLTAPIGFPLFPLYHPAAIIYDRSLRAVYEQDLLRLKELLYKMEERPIVYGQLTPNMV